MGTQTANVLRTAAQDAARETEEEVLLVATDVQPAFDGFTRFRMILAADSGS